MLSLTWHHVSVPSCHSTFVFNFAQWSLEILQQIIPLWPKNNFKTIIRGVCKTVNTNTFFKLRKVISKSVTSTLVSAVNPEAKNIFRVCARRAVLIGLYEPSLGLVSDISQSRGQGFQVWKVKPAGGDSTVCKKMSVCMESCEKMALFLTWCMTSVSCFLMSFWSQSFKSSSISHDVHFVNYVPI